MKSKLILFFILCWTSFAFASDITDKFDEEYKALLPRYNSSVDSDYIYEQIALSGEYTVKLLDQINTDNAQLNEKFDALNEKLDTLIDQNKKLIELLKKNKTP